jgi:phage terminase large subunit-like protein
MMIAPVFGWYRSDGARRFSEAYNELPRKNGKTTIAAGVALYALTADGEQGAEVYCAATKHAQAMILFQDCKNMVALQPLLSKRVQSFKWSMYCPRLRSTLSPLASDENNLDGLNSHVNIIDELHQHKTRGVYDKLASSHGSRSNPLDFIITTAGTGDDPHSIATDRHSYAEGVIKGTIKDDSFHGFITCADREDDWQDPAIWSKANPNLDVSVSRRFLEDQATRAAHSTAYQNVFRRYYLNQWVEQSVRWLSLDQWDACRLDDAGPDLTGRPCYAGLDLADGRDLNALALYFPDATPGRDMVRVYFWCPERTIQARTREGKVGYQQWVDDGLIETTPGAVTDYGQILDRVREIASTYR